MKRAFLARTGQLGPFQESEGRYGQPEEPGSPE